MRLYNFFFEIATKSPKHIIFMNCHEIVFFSTFHCSRLALFSIKLHCNSEIPKTQRNSNTTHIFFRKCKIRHCFSCSMWRMPIERHLQSIHGLTDYMTLAVFKLCILCTLTVGHPTVLLTGANKRNLFCPPLKSDTEPSHTRWSGHQPPSPVTSSSLSSPSGTLISGSQVSAQEVHVPLSATQCVSPSYLLSQLHI